MPSVLGRADIGPCDDFFQLGGTSIGVFAVIADLHLRTGSELSFGTVIRNPTVELMAGLLRDEYADGGRSLIAIVEGERRPALACGHPLGGSVLWYRHLARSMPRGVPTLGLQARAAARLEPDRDIPTMAHHYRRELNERYAPEELVLCGYSFGGLVAFERAGQLSEGGRVPAGVALLDTRASRRRYDPPPRARLLWSLAGHALRLTIDIERLAQLPDHELCVQLRESAVNVGVPPAELGLDRIKHPIDLSDQPDGVRDVPA